MTLGRGIISFEVLELLRDFMSRVASIPHKPENDLGADFTPARQITCVKPLTRIQIFQSMQ